MGILSRRQPDPFDVAHEEFRTAMARLRELCGESTMMLHTMFDPEYESEAPGRYPVARAEREVLDNAVYTAMEAEGGLADQIEEARRARDASSRVYYDEMESDEYLEIWQNNHPHYQTIRSGVSVSYSRSNVRGLSRQYLVVSLTEQGREQQDARIEDLEALAILFAGESGLGHLRSMIDTVAEHTVAVASLHHEIEGLLAVQDSEVSRREQLESFDRRNDRLTELARLI